MRKEIRVGDVWEFNETSEWRIKGIWKKHVSVEEVNGYHCNPEYKKSNFQQPFWKLISRPKENLFDSLYERMK